MNTIQSFESFGTGLFSIDNTRKQGVLYTDYNSIVSVFGEPNNTGEWAIKYNDNIISTIYPIGSGNLQNATKWHIGGQGFTSFDKVISSFEDAGVDAEFKMR
jgi:hypothetical protein